MAEKKGAAMVLLQFFGKEKGQTSQDFMEELRALSEDEKFELAREAAKELGVELRDDRTQR